MVDGFLEATRHRFAGKAFTLDEERNADVGKKLVGVGGDGVHHFVAREEHERTTVGDRKEIANQHRQRPRVGHRIGRGIGQAIRR